MVLLHLCVCLREKDINNSHQSSTSCLSQQLVCRSAVRIINYTRTLARTHTLTHYIITVNSCRAGLASTQITSLSQVYFNNGPPFSPPGPLLHNEPKGIWLASPVWAPNSRHGPLTPPALHTTEVAFDPRRRVREKSGRAPVSGRRLEGWESSG